MQTETVARRRRFRRTDTPFATRERTGDLHAAREASEASTAPLRDGQLSRPAAARTLRNRRILIVADAVAAVLVAAIVIPLATGRSATPLALLALPLLLGLSKLASLYDRDDLALKPTTLDETPRLLQIAGLFTLLLWAGLAAEQPLRAEPLALLGVWGAAFGLQTALRALARAAARRGAPTERCVIVGEPASIAAVAEKLDAPGLNVEIVATLDLRQCETAQQITDTFTRLIGANRVDRAIIAPPPHVTREVLELVRVAKHLGVKASVVPRVIEVVGLSVQPDYLDGLTLLSARRFGLTPTARVVKRTFDIVGATIGLIACLPLMAAIALAIRLDSPGPVFFRQRRVGRDGAHFTLLKFRSMVPDAETSKPALLPFNDTSGLFKLVDDPRVTRIGHMLRSSCLDELPQLVNVLRGDMSLVGPRPLVLDEDSRVTGLDRQRLHLTPGMTGHWQILGSARVPLHEMVGIDYLYVADWSLWNDVKILLRTVPYMVARRGV